MKMKPCTNPHCPVKVGLYVVPHPRKAGYFVYCADCDRCSPPKPTEREAVEAWNAGEYQSTVGLDRSEF